MRALVVDDSRVARRALIGILKHNCGFSDVEEAADGEEGLKVAEEGDFDLILLDWNMPKMSGIETLRAIREKGEKTPIVMVTSEAERARVVEAFGAGANNYIVKPYGTKIVKDKVDWTLQHADEASKRTLTRRALIADDSAVLRKLLESALKEHCGFTEFVQVEDGQQAVDATGNNIFDLILLDWNMPNMSGIEALRKIRSNDKRTPIVMVTSEKEGARVVEAFDAGANNYIIKPFDAHILSKKVAQVMHLYS